MYVRNLVSGVWGKKYKNKFPSCKLEENKVYTGFEVYGSEKLEWKFSNTYV